jgi:hypothetical protein
VVPVVGSRILHEIGLEPRPVPVLVLVGELLGLRTFLTAVLPKLSSRQLTVHPLEVEVLVVALGVVGLSEAAVVAAEVPLELAIHATVPGADIKDVLKGAIVDLAVVLAELLASAAAKHAV